METNKILTYIFIFSLLAVLGSCSQTKKEFYNNGSIKREYSIKNKAYDGQYKEYYTNGNLKVIHNYKNGKLVDSSLFYNETEPLNIDYIRYYKNDSIKEVVYNNGILLKEGFINEKYIGIGNWKFYNKKGFLNIVREYKIISGKQYLNQAWHFNEKGDTIFAGNFCKIDIAKDTISLLEPFKAVAYLYVPFFSDKASEAFVLIPSKEDESFSQDFSNEYNIKLDTFYNLSKDIKNQKWFPKNNHNYTVVFGKKFKSPGKKIIRGYVMEFYVNQAYNDVDSITREERKIYFEKEIFVKDNTKEIPKSKEG